MAWRGQQSRRGKQTHRGDAVGVKIPIKNRERGARMITEHGRIERKAREYDDEQTDARQAQSQRPAHCDPLSIELDWENQRDEEQRCTAEERELCISSRAGERRAFEQHSKPQKRRHPKRRGYHARNTARISAANELIHQIKV